ncbi:MAG: DUF3127 domain-containing protein [Bacteroidota bacterium]
METEGKLIHVMPVQNIDTAKGKLKKLEFVIETKTKFPKKVCFALWNEKAENFNFNTGDELKIAFDLESRESKGRWYTEAKAWKVEHSNSQGMTNNRPVQPDLPANLDIPPEPTELDDLPF